MASTTVIEPAASFPLATAHGGLLKMDTLGRVRTTLERRQAIVDEFERSGVSGAQFAKITGLKYTTFANWVQQRRRGAQPGRRPERLHLVEAVVDPTTPAQGLVLHLPGGVRMELTAAAQVPLAVGLIKALQPAPPGC